MVNHAGQSLVHPFGGSVIDWYNVDAMLFYGFEQWYVAYERNWKSDTVWGVRLWIPYLALPVGFAVFLIQLLIDLYGVLSGADDSLELKGHS